MALYLQRYYTDSESNDREASKLLCPSIAKDIQVELLKPIIAQITVFRGCSDQFVIAVAGLLDMMALPSQTTLFNAGDYGDALYIVHSGVLAVIVESVTVRDIRKGSCFGELSVFSALPRTATVISMTYVTLYKLAKFHCDKLLEGYPDCADLIVGHVQDVLNQLKRTEISDDTNHLTCPITKPSDTLSQRASIRRASLEAAFVAGASAVLKLLSRGRLAAPSQSTQMMSWLLKRSVVSREKQLKLPDGQENKSKMMHQEGLNPPGTHPETIPLNPYELNADPTPTLAPEKYGICYCYQNVSTSTQNFACGGYCFFS
ncbi:unnamed protein product [Phytophthora fragariaefolia]|uniref:Unnamed protein product n=1 Tax=Phytophthora fragariaefolia TaxID=1490495 RepID=A0A9W7CYI4_9STRA|nr:unnamed protein product [Phytophthora fragariaefolia]